MAELRSKLLTLKNKHTSWHPSSEETISEENSARQGIISIYIRLSVECILFFDEKKNYLFGPCVRG